MKRNSFLILFVFVSPFAWSAQTVLSTSLATGGIYYANDLLVTKTGSLEVNSARYTAIRGGRLIVDGGSVIATGNNRDSYYASGAVPGAITEDSAYGLYVINGGKYTGFSNLFLGDGGAGLTPGLLKVDGAGSLVESSYVGGGFRYDTPANFQVTNSGTIKADSILLGIGTSASLYVGSKPGEAPTAPGILDVDEITLGQDNGIGNPAASGELTLNHTASDYVIRSDISTDVGGHGVIKVLYGATELTGNNIKFSGDIKIDGDSTLIAANTGLGSGNIENNAKLVIKQEQDGKLINKIIGSGVVEKTGVGLLTVDNPNTYTGGTVVREGLISIGNDLALGTGGVRLESGAGIAFNKDGLVLNNDIDFSADGQSIINFGQYNATLAGTLDGGFVSIGDGVLTVSGISNYQGDTDIRNGVLVAGGSNTLSPFSSYKLSPGASIETGGYNQVLKSLENSGNFSLLGSSVGSITTFNGSYVGRNGVLSLGVVLNDGVGPADKLVFDGPNSSASGNTSIQVVNKGGLGDLTSGDGIQLIEAKNGATTTAQTTKGAFSLNGGHVDAGAYEYRLFAGDSAGKGENWYLRSSLPIVGGGANITYRPEVSLYSSLLSQVRLGDFAMLGDMHNRKGDLLPGTKDVSRGLWARVISSDVNLRQGGPVSPQTSGHLTGYQVGTDLFNTHNWRGGVFVGQLQGSTSVKGFSGGLKNQGVGKNDIESRYLGVYGTYSLDNGFYVDLVAQSGEHDYKVKANGRKKQNTKGESFVGSAEVGKSFPVGDSRWVIEPQAQLIYQKVDLDDSKIYGAKVRLSSDELWTARLGVRLRGEFDTRIGAVQPYVRVSAYKSTDGTDRARFTTNAASTEINTASGGTNVEAAGGLSLALGKNARVYTELGVTDAAGGNVKSTSSLSTNLGVSVSF